MKNKSEVRFIRKNGRIIPIRGKKKNKEKKPPVSNLIKSKSVRQAITGLGAAAGAVFAGKKIGKTLIEKGIAGSFGFLGGAFLTGGLANTKYTKKAKGETRKQLARRVSIGNKAYNKMYKK